MVILPLKVLKLSNRGSLTFPALWYFAEGLFYFLNYFIKKEGFLEFIIVYKIQNKCTID
jgi:hypothetical protein